MAAPLLPQLRQPNFTASFRAKKGPLLVASSWVFLVCELSCGHTGFMGMDLVPVNRQCDPVHFNWTGWRMIGELLEDTGADLSLFSGSNDGEKVDKATALKWAASLKQVMGNLVVVEVPDPTYQGGKRTHVRVLPAQLKNPTSAVEPQKETMAETGEFPGLEEEVERQRLVSPTTRDPDDRDISWIEGFIAFLENCEGFYQY